VFFGIAPPMIQYLGRHDLVFNILDLPLRKLLLPIYGEFSAQLDDCQEFRPGYISLVPEKLRMFYHIGIKIIKISMLAIERPLEMELGLGKLRHEKVYRHVGIPHQSLPPLFRYSSLYRKKTYRKRRKRLENV
jgi:hypothetical protein